MPNHVFQELLNDSFSQFKDNTAVVDGDRHITYNELDRLSNGIANQMLSRAIKKETFVGILSGHRTFIIEAIIGILKAQAIFVPLDIAHPVERLKTLIRLVGLRFILCDKNTYEGLISPGETGFESIEFIFFDDIFSRVSGDSNNSLATHLTGMDYGENDKIYLYFTSGSTGTPKAVLGRNRSLTHFILWEINTFGITGEFRVSQLTAPGFDAFLRDVFVPLLAGGMVCIPPANILPNEGELTRWLDTSRIHLLHCVPSLFRLIATSTLTPDHFRDIKYILLSGEKITPADLTHWYSIFDRRIQLVNLYGPTETTMIKSFYMIQPSDIKRERIPIGKPMKGARLMVCNKKLEMCDELVTGEIYIRTPFRTFGYYADDQANKERFIPNPFIDDPNDLLYKTGDLGRLLPDGNFEFLGRMDRQIKIRGIRVELDEIEKVLKDFPGVNDTAVVNKELPNSEQLLFAFIVGSGSTGDPDLFVSDIKSYLATRLPIYMIPARLMVLDILPRTPSGKVEYNKLLDFFIDEVEDVVVPRDEMEIKLAAIWSQVLKTGNIGANSNFFELGGNSLNIVPLLSRIHKEFNVRLHLEVIFENPTVEEQVQLIKRAERDKFVPIRMAEKREYYPLSPMQRRLYFLQYMEPGNTAYNIPQVWELRGGMQEQRLKKIVEELINRHESLRTSFYLLDGVPVQLVLEPKALKFAILAREVKDPIHQELKKFTQEFIHSFDLSRAPLLRMGLVKQGKTRCFLVVDLHHIISDAISHRILVREFLDLYQGKALPRLNIQYKDFSLWQNQILLQKEITRLEAFWLKEFRTGAPLLNLPLDYPRAAIQRFEGHTQYFEPGKEEIRLLKKMALEQGVTIFMLLQALFTVLLSKLSGQEDIVIGTPIAGRRHTDLEKVIGTFINTLLLRNFPIGEKTFIQFLGEVKERALQAFEHQDYPFEELIDKTALVRDLSRNPLFDVMFMLQDVDSMTPRSTAPGHKTQVLKARAYKYENETSKFDLTLAGWQKDENLTFTLQYCKTLFSANTIERFIRYFKQITMEVVKVPRKRLAEIEMISLPEKQQIITGFNNTETPYPQEKTIQQLFQEQTDRTPDDTALIGKMPHPGPQPPETGLITYRELNKNSGQLARLLIQKGIGPGSIVGIMIGRTTEMMIGLLAILKAGAAYLPIDPGYPPERIEYMLKDSGAQVLIIGNSSQSSSLYSSPPALINLSEERLFDTHPSGLLPFLPCQSSGLAYIIYTSGSTGNPKGVAVRHQSAVNFIKGMTSLIDFSPGKTILAVTTFSFDIFFLETLLPLTLGLAVVIAGEAEQKDPQRLTDLITAYGVEMVQVTPSMLQLLNNIPGKPWFLHKVKELMVGGEAFPVHLFKEVKEKYAGRLYNMYGPTETTIWSAVKDLTSAAPEELNIGTPIVNTRVYILNKHNGLQPIGVVGELWIGGDGLSAGYLNNPQLTAEKFIKTPIHSPMQTSHISGLSHKSYIYRTGDLARWLASGEIQCLGRVDNQVKLRGYRIELSEIENRLLMLEGIREAVVAIYEDNEIKTICAYIVFSPQIKLNVEELRENLSAALPDYMVPSYFIPLEKLPLTPNGKVNRKALPQPGGIRPGMRVAYTAPQTDREKIVAQLWREVLNLDRVGVYDNFFDLGGNSMKLIQLNARLKETLDCNISVVAMFRYPTIHSLIEYLNVKDDNVKVPAGKTVVEEINASLEVMEETLGLIESLTGG